MKQSFSGAGLIELDLHGMSWVQAQAAIDAKIKRAPASVYRLRLIHGYHGGSVLKEQIRKTYKKHPKVLRLELGLDPGITDLVLREF